MQILLSAAVILLTAGCEFMPLQYEQPFSRSYAASEGTLVSVHNISGQITVRETAGSMVTIEGIKRGLTQEETDKIRIVVGTEIIDNKSGDEILSVTTLFNGDDPELAGVDYTISVPAGMAIEIAGRDGDVRISGDIPLRSLKLENGNTVIKSARSAENLNILDGNLEIRDTTTVGNIQVEDGDIIAEVRSVTGNRVISAEYGSITILADRNLNARITTEVTGSGSAVNNAVTAGTPYQLGLKTTRGDITVNQL
ncbi:MAG: hypothetical protein ACOCVC_00455 [Spirochaeta sp.]